MRILLFTCLAGLTLIACAPPAHIRAVEEASVSRGDWPEILPLQDLLNAGNDTASTQISAQEQGARLTSRVNGLKSRARRLQGPVIDEARRARLLAALSRENG
ncbi:hypothetical protein [Halocynthiibacter styelae]|uniref:Uncharacterized protein n=1 Tax=Halocynthiibacter styelae TaxID=2761955 RepID=A0A8J7IVR4_9RHOB|nr:hypothetical protein [Paenihalocynthiibacter styelae]MBI1493533.1 hypothetical protein [Paenihalocynthiibacter styelae]